MTYLLKPLNAGMLTLNNRLVMPPMATAKAGIGGDVSKELLDHYAEKSAGGYIGLIIVEHSYVLTEGKAGERQLSAAADRMVEGLKKLSAVIHKNGSRAVLQITHAGSGTTKDIVNTTPVAPSAVAHPRLKTMPRDLTGEEINNIIDAFQNAARRSKEAGFDGVEIHSAHGYLLNQFFSPLTNKRTDDYGGNVYNRIRIHLQIIEAIRSVVGDSYPILVRLGASDFTEGGTTVEDSKIAAKEFEKATVNILDISGGFSWFTGPGLTGEGYFAPLSEAVKSVVSIPVILTGGIKEARTAEKLIAEGKADLIGVGRAILKDSDWARRAVESLQ